MYRGHSRERENHSMCESLGGKGPQCVYTELIRFIVQQTNITL